MDLVAWDAGNTRVREEGLGIFVRIHVIRMRWRLAGLNGVDHGQHR